MAPSPVALAAVSSALAGLAYAAFAVRAVRLGALQAPWSGRASAFACALAASSAWGFLALFALVFGSPLLSALSMAADLFRYGCWYVFVGLAFRSNAARKVPQSLRWIVPLAATAWGINLALFIAALADRAGNGFTVKAIQLSWIVLPLLGLMLVEQLVRNATDDARWNAKPLCLGLAGTFAFDAYLYSQAILFGRLDPESMDIRGAVHAVMLPLLMLSMSRRRNWFPQVQVSRSAVFHSATLLIAGVYLLLVSVIGYYLRFFGGEIGGALRQILLVAALVGMAVFAVSGAVRARLRVFLAKHFFRYRYDYREEWLKFTHTLSSQDSPQQMGLQVIRGLADMLESPAGALWTSGLGKQTFSQVARWNTGECRELESAESSLCRFLSERGWVINLTEFREHPELYHGLELPSWLQELPHAWLIVPLKVGAGLTGFVVLASPRTPMDVNWEVNDLLRTAGRQGASFLAQMQATEDLLEVKKFDAFNRMSAFVVHDLKNIVTQLSLMVKNAKRLHANPEFQQDMLITVENSLDRMRQLMLQLREGATPAGTSFGVDLAAVIERMRTIASGRGRALEVQIADRVVARGDNERLERIIGHVVQNALDATDKSGEVSISLRRVDSQARIEVRDTGHGMSQEFVQNRLFKPFQTTKQAGMGIGAYESFQYVQELGGKTIVDSEPEVGTSIVLLLPLFAAKNTSDLHAHNAS